VLSPFIDPAQPETSSRSASPSSPAGPEELRRCPRWRGLRRPRRQLDFTQQLNALHRERLGADNALNARIESLELAYRMQSAAAAFDISREPESSKALYGVVGDHARVNVTINGGFSGMVYARNCLLARRLLERGVRVVQIYCGNLQPWDTHSNNAEGHRRLAQAVDRPIAALLQDSEAARPAGRHAGGLGGEFGRTPATEGGNGRDHNITGSRCGWRAAASGAAWPTAPPASSASRPSSAASTSMTCTPPCCT
jgi:uncharacterized protein (DUF1501 family)